MFRKIVSNLSFSPALVGQLGFYAKRLRKEEATRRIGLIFVVLALIVQGLAVFQPPESANAASDSDLVYGGLGLGANRSINNYLNPYDANTNHLKDITDYVGITRAEIAASTYSSFQTSSDKLSWGHNQKYSAAQGERQVTVTNSTGTIPITTVYARPTTLSNGADERIYAWIGHSAKIGWFAIMQACGNIVTQAIPTPPTPPPAPPAPTPTPPTPTPPTPITKITESKTAINLTQGSVNATTVTARESDQIKYTISAKNEGNVTTTVKLSDELADVLEYSTVVDQGGATLDPATKTLSWPDVSLTAGTTATRTFAVRLLNTIPSTAQGASEPTSFDCKIMNVFGNSISINVTCPTPKVVEAVVTQLPHTGPTENLIFAGAVLAVTTYFYARTRQVKKEVRLIRRDLSVGTI